MKKFILAFLSVLLFPHLSIGQTQFADITVTVQSVTHLNQCGCSDQGFFQCGIASSQPDPRWNVRSRLFGGAFSATTFIEIDDQDCGTISRSDNLATYLSSCDDQLVIEVESWEDDDSPSNTFNGVDDNHSGTETFSIFYQNDPTSSLNTYTLTLSNNWRVEIGVVWTVASIVGAPSISGTTSLCSGDNLSLTAFDPLASNYNWYNVPSGGTPISTGANLNIGNVTANVSYYAAGSIGACEGPRTPVNVTAENPPNAGAGTNTTICDSQNAFDLFSTLIGNDVGGTWNDDDASGALTGSSFDATSLGGGSYDFTYTVFGTVCSDDLETVTITVEQSLTAGIGTNTTICDSQNAFDLFSTLSANDIGGTWNDDDGTGALSGNFLNATLISAADYDFTYTVFGTDCPDNSETVTITIEEISTDPSSLTPSITSICGIGGTVDLTINGGSLGTGASWEWYDGDPNGGGTFLTSTGTTALITGLTITATTNYFVRAEGGFCGNSNTVDVSVVVSSSNTAPSSVTVTSSTICSGNTADLTVIGGVLGSGANWTWYDTDPASGSPAPLFASTSPFYLGAAPPTTTTYFVRAEGCDTTIAQQTTITVVPPSVAAAGINASQTSFCSGSGSTLSIQGGTLGAGATWEWYEGGCGAGSSIASGTSINVSPTAATSYYVRAEGGCNGNTACVNIAISIDVPSADPVAITSASTDLCLGETTVLNVSGGTLGTGAQWEWYQGSCGGISVGQGSSISVSPSISTTYYARAEGACGNTVCVNIPVSVGAGASDPTAVDVIQNNICPGDIAQVYVTGAPLAPEYTWVWYTGSCGAVTVGIGDTLEVTPLLTTVYYVRAVGTCGETNCGSVTVTVDPGSISADGISSSNDNFCEGDSATLQILGGSLVAGANWNWYESLCGGTSIGTGSSIMVYPTSTTTYYARAEGGTCGSTVCSNITLHALPSDAYLIPFDTICGTEGPISLNNGIPDGGVYEGPGISNGILIPSDAGIGTHSISYSYIGSNGCTALASSTFTIKESSIVASSSITINDCEEGGVTLLVDVTGGTGLYRYKWSNGENTNPLVESLSGFYSVTVTDDNQCSAFIDGLEITDDMRCFDLPNSFTPNGDGMNDMWNLDLTYYSTAAIKVYSKWGNQVWEASGTTLSWDGTSNGKDLPSGTYYYVLDIDNGNNMQNGPVTIVR